MSEHTKGRLTGDVEGYLFDQENNCVACIGSWEAPIQTSHNTSRLAAAWNAFDGISPPLIEFIADNGGVQLILSEASKTEMELNAVRALLRDIGGKDPALMPCTMSPRLAQRIRDYLDACDKPGEPT